jgi:hypothetical protein
LKVYVEGGGDTVQGQARLRQAFGKFLENYFRRNGRFENRPSFDPSGSREQTVAAYKNGLRDRPSERSMVLIDSEAPKDIATDSWAFLRELANSSNPDKFQWTHRPPSAREDDLHFMVQSMETWLVADLAALKKHYGPKYQTARVANLSNRRIEEMSPSQTVAAIKDGAGDCPNREYRKTVDGPAVLANAEPDRVAHRCPHAQQFLEALTAALRDAANQRRRER